MPVVLLQVEVAICVVVFVMVGTIVVFGLLLAVLSLLQEVNKVVVFVNGGVGDVVPPRLAVMSVCRHAATPNDPTGTWGSRR